MRKSILALSAALTLSISAISQDTLAHKQALVAGYKAAFTCSALFNANKPLKSINDQELSRIYPDFRKILESLPDAIIDPMYATVSVTYSDTMPPRISIWRPQLGCAQMPIGADINFASSLPTIKNENIEPQIASEEITYWPDGDNIHNCKCNEKLNAVINKAFDGNTYGDGVLTSAILVTSATEMLGEQYIETHSPSTSQRTWSVAKSIAASVIGIAVKEGIIDVKAPANIPEWDNPMDPRKAITLENLLHMSSGLYSGKSGSRTDQIYAGGARVTDRATEAPLDAMPGTRWRYANNDTLLAMRSLRASINDDAAYLAYPFKKLLNKIGMNNTRLETDWEGNFIMSSQVWTTARDLARLGILYLNDGSWNSEQILPKGWGNYVSTPAPNQPPLTNAKGTKIRGYGAQFWLPTERFGLPSDGYLAAGHRGQYIYIVPSLDLVIIRRGYDESGGIGFDMNAFSRDVLAAIE